MDKRLIVIVAITRTVFPYYMSEQRLIFKSPISHNDTFRKPGLHSIPRRKSLSSLKRKSPCVHCSLLLRCC